MEPSGQPEARPQPAAGQPAIPKGALSLARRVAGLPAGEYVIRLSRRGARIEWQVLRPYAESEEGEA